MKYIIMLSSLLLLLIMSNCREPLPEPLPPVVPPVTPISKDTFPVPLVWETYVWSDTTRPFYPHNFSIIDGVVVYDIGLADEQYRPMRARNMVDGQLRWDWQDYLKYGSSSRRIKSFTNFGHYFAFNEGEEVYLVRPKSGNTTGIVNHPLDHSYSNQVVPSFDNYLYFSSHKQDTVFYFRMDAQAQLDTLWYQTDGDFQQRYASNCTSWQHPNGDTLLIIVDNPEPSSPRPPSYAQINIVGYNITADSLQFIIEDVDSIGHTPPPEIPMIQGDRLFITGAHVLHGFDLVKGEHIWTKEYPDSEFFGYYSIIHEDVIITNDSNGMYATDLDGNQLWINRAAHGGVEMAAYNGVVYACTNDGGKLKAVDVHTGLLLWKAYPPRDAWNNDASFSQTGIGIDQATERMVVSDKYSVLCFQLPKK